MATPIHWGKNQPGMQAKEELEGWRRSLAIGLWRLSGYITCLFALLLYYVGAHKQIANRIIEPWSHINVLVTSVHWANFLALRNHPDAQPEIMELARLVHIALSDTGPVRLKNDEWHLPYITSEDHKMYDLETLIQISVSRCASVSYKTVDGKPMDAARAVPLYAKLLAAAPLHASPAEHQAYPDTKSYNEFFQTDEWDRPEYHGNLTGWCQYRKTLKNEYVPDEFEVS